MNNTFPPCFVPPSLVVKYEFKFIEIGLFP